MAVTHSKNAWREYYKQDVRLFARKMTYISEGMSWDATPCAYCGDPATTKSPIFPIKFFNRFLRTKGRLPLPAARIIVPACSECHRLGKDALYHGFNVKKSYIKTRLQECYKNIVELPLWEDAEIAELGDGLRSYIQVGADARNRLMERLRY